MTSEQTPVMAASQVKVRPTGGVGRGEWRFVFICALVMLALAAGLVAFGYLVAPADRVFTGLVTRTPDVAQYLSWLRGFTGADLIDNQLTPEPTEPVYFNLLWWLLAKVSALTGLDGVALAIVFQMVSIAALAAALYWFISLLVTDLTRRRFAFLVAYFGGGLGWVWVVAKYVTGAADASFPFDLYTLEPNSFLSMLTIQHFTISMASYLVIYGLFMRALETRRWRYALMAGGAAVLLGWQHPYDMLLIYAVMGIFVLLVWLRDGFSWRPALYLGAIALLSVWPALYSLYITRAYPGWQVVLAQFENADAFTPDPLHLLILLGLPLIAALLGFDGLVPLRRRSHRELFIRAWFGANLFLVYVPFDFQIHYLNGWQVPIAILATGVLFERILPWAQEQGLWRRLVKRVNPRTLQRAALAAVLLAVLAVNFYLYAWHLVVLRRLPHDNFLYKDEVAALEWIEQHAGSDDVVLSGLSVGQYIPFRTGARAFMGHWAMTRDIYAKQEAARSFYDPLTPDIYRRDLIRRFGIDYVFFGPDERAETGFDPAASPFLNLCFSAPQARVYCVDPATLSALPPETTP